MSRNYVCHECGEWYSLEQLEYICSSCGVNPDLAPWLQNSGRSRRPVSSLMSRGPLKFFREEERLACRDHPEGSVTLYCPASCGAPLTVDNFFGARAPLSLGIFGPRGAGKTLYATVMAREILHWQGADGFTLGLTGLGETEARFGRINDRLKEGRRPLPTREEDPTGQRRQDALDRRLSWKLQPTGNGSAPMGPILLSTYDVSGNTLDRPSHEALPDFDRFSHSLTSMIYLLDGAALARDLGLEVKDAWEEKTVSEDSDGTDRTQFTNIRGRLADRSKRVDLAIVLSKVDYFWDKPGWESLRAEASTQEVATTLTRMLVQTGRNPMLVAAMDKEHGFRSVKLMAVSSLGFCPRRRDVKAEGGELKLKFNKLKPVGVLSPLFWLLGRRRPDFARALREN